MKKTLETEAFATSLSNNFTDSFWCPVTSTLLTKHTSTTPPQARSSRWGDLFAQHHYQEELLRAMKLLPFPSHHLSRVLPESDDKTISSISRLQHAVGSGSYEVSLH